MKYDKNLEASIQSKSNTKNTKIIQQIKNKLKVLNFEKNLQHNSNFVISQNLNSRESTASVTILLRFSGATIVHIFYPATSAVHLLAVPRWAPSVHILVGVSPVPTHHVASVFNFTPVFVYSVVVLIDCFLGPLVSRLKSECYTTDI